MPFSQLRPDPIITSLERLTLRIGERFPEAGLVDVCRELLDVAERSRRRVRDLQRPYVFLRTGTFLVVFAGLVALSLIVREVSGLLRIDDAATDAFSVFEGLDAALNTLILLGAGVYFLATLEERVKRNKALADLHKLRSIAHVIDMHQLTKDPVAILNPHARTKSSPERDMTAFELNRYLDYCSEMLSLTGKVAALYGQSASDPVVIQQVSDVEALATNLSRKIWQKIMTIPHGPELSPGAAASG
jgi:hypothetical protein